MTISCVSLEAEERERFERKDGFGLFLDAELTREVKSMNHLITCAGEARVKAVRLYFGSVDKHSSIHSVNDIPIYISSNTHPEENVCLGYSFTGGVDKAVSMWFTLSKEEETEISITSVTWD